ncbi:MAG: hypothetical protein JOZ79_09110, partial [Sphingomonas sp.]|nr:hypothetical protein [Sphingomonas sp.]
MALAQANPSASVGQHGTPNNLGTGTGDIPGSSMGLPDISAGGLKGSFGLDLSQRITEAEKLVDQVDHGRVLGDGDTRRIRNLMREDFVAW